MTCRLILTRHAKSAWNTEAPSDHARPLNDRGRASAQALGHWLRERDAQPDQVISSSAQRNRETFELMELDVPVMFTDRLYLATSEIILNVLHQTDVPNVMILGHNPGLLEFAHQILKHSPPHSRFEDYPTGATLIAEFDIADWSALRFNTGKAIDFIVPRELLGEAA